MCNEEVYKFIIENNRIMRIVIQYLTNYRLTEDKKQ